MKCRFKIILSVCFVFAVFFCIFISASAYEIWDGQPSSTAPSINSAGFYQCRNAKDLAWAAKQVNAGYTSLKIKLINDIYLNDVDNEIFNNNWTPIGNKEKKFDGIFDGNNHIIYGLYIQSEENYQGLFGYAHDAEIYNIKLMSCNIRAGEFVGGICGYAENSASFSGCTVSGDITATGGDCAGITGYSKTYCIYNSCGFTGTIHTNGNRCGGITGCITANGVIEKCFNKSDIYSNGKYVGGIVGTCSGSKVVSCYNTGSLNGFNRVGGIVGNNVGNVFACYNVGQVTCEREKGAICAFNSLAEVQFCYFESGSCESGDMYGLEKSSADMKRYSLILSLNKNDGDYIRDYQEENNGYPILSWELKSDVWTGGTKKPSLYIDGKTYMITNSQELAWFAGLVNGTLEDEPQDRNADAILMKSILLNLGEPEEDASNVWTPIGVSSPGYSGNFNGNGKTVSGLYIPEGEVCGLFGFLSENSVISNMTINGAVISGDSAGTAAYENRGILRKIKCSYCTVNSVQIGGGITGVNLGTIESSSFAKGSLVSLSDGGGVVGVNNGIILSSYCCSQVKCKSYSGGICAINNSRVLKSYNCSEISSSNSICAGICAKSENGLISYCYNTGKINAYTSGAGICADAINSEISVCYSVADVSAAKNSYAVCAQNKNTVFENCFYDSKRLNITDNNAVGLETSQMTGNNAVLYMTGFTRSDWTTSSDEGYYLYYPQITDFLTSGDSEYYDDSRNSVQFLKYDYHCKICVNETDSYFTTIKEAVDSVGDNKSTIYVFSDYEVDETTIVNDDITVVAESKDITLSRNSSFNGNFFEVNGQLNIGNLNDEYKIIVDGSHSDNSPSDSLIKVMSGTFNLYCGSLTGNTCINGGAIYNRASTNIYDGEISSCNALSCGGAIYNIGSLKTDGANIVSNVAFEKGGAVYSKSVSSNIELKSGKISSNNASSGGAVYIETGEVFETGCEINLNTASKGGAVYVKNGIFNCLGGIIEKNNADVGKAVYNENIFNMGNNGFVDTDNDVYLPEGKTVTMTSKIDSNTLSVNITPEKYEKNIRVVDGMYAASNFRRVYINDYESQNWHINSSGYLLTDEVVEVALVSILGAHSVYYTSLEEAFDDIGENDAIITLVGDVTVNKTLVLRSNVTILSDENVRSVFCSETLEGPVFKINENTSLVLGDNSNNMTSDLLYFDAVSHNSSSYFDVERGGSLKIYNSAVLRNMDSDVYSHIDNKGTTEIYGGKIVENRCLNGAVKVSLYGTLNFYGGTIENEGISVCSYGTFKFLNNSTMPNQIVKLVNSVITLDNEYSAETKIASIMLEHYTIGTLCVKTELDKTLYSKLFDICDSCFYLNNEMRIDAQMLTLKDSSAICLDNEKGYVYGIDVDVNTAGNIASQFANDNVVIYDLNGNNVSPTGLCATKYRVCLVDSNGNVYDEKHIIIYGDVNCDGLVDGEDAVYINFINYGFIENVDEIILEASDVNHDGVIDLSDSWIVEDTGLYNNIISQKTGG